MQGLINRPGTISRPVPVLQRGATPVKCAVSRYHLPKLRDKLGVKISPQYHLPELQGKQGAAGQANGHRLTQIYPVKSFDGRLPKVAFNKAGTDSFSSPTLKSRAEQMMWWLSESNIDGALFEVTNCDLKLDPTFKSFLAMSFFPQAVVHFIKS